MSAIELKLRRQVIFFFIFLKLKYSLLFILFFKYFLDMKPNMVTQAMDIVRDGIQKHSQDKVI